MQSNNYGRGGRPTKCTPEVIEFVRAELAKGTSRTQAARMAGIDDESFSRWMKRGGQGEPVFAEFAEAVKSGEDEFRRWEQNEILQSAKKSLRVLIEGQEYEETQTEYENDGNGQPRIKKQITKTKKILPSTTAVIFALCNRDPEHWKNRVTNEVEAKVQAQADNKVSLANVPDELLEQLVKAINGE